VHQNAIFIQKDKTKFLGRGVPDPFPSGRGSPPHPPLGALTCSPSAFDPWPPFQNPGYMYATGVVVVVVVVVEVVVVVVI